MPKEKLIIEDAKVKFRNFTGVGTDYNREGDRNFSIVIDDEETALKMREAGWNIRGLGDPADLSNIEYILTIKVRLDSNWPPKIYTVAPNGVVTLLDEDMVGDLDQADIDHVDVRVNPSYWEMNGKTGIAAYLETLYVVLEEDRLAAKYAQQEHPREGVPVELDLDTVDNGFPF